MKTFIKVTIIIWTLAFFGGFITGKSVFAKDCKYVQKIILDDNNVILSAKTEYVCKESKPIIVLPPKTTDEIKRVVPRATSHTEYMNMVYGNNNSDYGLDFLVKLFYNSN